MESLCFKPVAAHVITGSHISARAHPAHVSSQGRGGSISVQGSSSTLANLYSTLPLRSPLPGGERRGEGNALERGGEREQEEEAGVGEIEPHLHLDKEARSWVMKILQIRSLWSGKGRSLEGNLGSDQIRCCGCDEEESDGCIDGDGDGMEMEFDQESFSRLLRRVSLVEAKVYAQMAYLGSLAYSIPEIKPRNLLKHKGLHFVTSSLEKKAQLANAEKEQMSSLEKKPQFAATEDEHMSCQAEEEETEEAGEVGKPMSNGYRISASAAYQIAATAASYVQSHTRSFLSFRTRGTTVEELPNGGGETGNTNINGLEVASFVATTNSVTAVVAGKEEMKQAVAKDLSSARSSPCEWFICDDDSCGTRYFVIQGSESLGSWQVNLLFEPIRFEALDVLVHRGNYEAAKGIYEQILPEVRAYLKSHGNSATFRFTGHSLGGSLSLLLNLMLLIRGEVPVSSLLPVITFGSPYIMCGGDSLLHELGLPESHVQAIIMHRDIVPRAFSCSYPDRVAEILKALNRNFRNYPCLNNQKILYAPLGKLLILQPHKKLSPHHNLLPSGSGLYLLGDPLLDSDDLVKQICAAKAMFLNSPHPLDILSDPSAYGANGAITKNHEMNAYLWTLQSVIRQELKHIRKVKREQRRKAWWPLVAPQRLHSGTIMDQPAETFNVGLRQLLMHF